MPQAAAGAQTTPRLISCHPTTLLHGSSPAFHAGQRQRNRLCFSGVAQGKEDFESSLSCRKSRYTLQPHAQGKKIQTRYSTKLMTQISKIKLQLKHLELISKLHFVLSLQLPLSRVEAFKIIIIIKKSPTQDRLKEIALSCLRFYSKLSKVYSITIFTVIFLRSKDPRNNTRWLEQHIWCCNTQRSTFLQWNGLRAPHSQHFPSKGCHTPL